MAEKTTLRGIAWDHPRGYEPLKVTSAEYTEKHPEVCIKWDTRSLKEFGDMPIEDLISSYDLITIDHPYMGQAHNEKLLVPLQEHLSDSILNDLAEQSIGPSFQSYCFENNLYALPIDAAALVAASRHDLIARLNIPLPQNREELFDFYEKIPSRHKVAWPLCPTDLWCTFLTLCAQDGGRDFLKKFNIEEKLGSDVLDELKQHLEYLHPESLRWNPIQVLDDMGTDDEIIYAPFLFGYTNYAREGYTSRVINFSNSPTNPNTDVTTILGGVGLAISSKCQYIDRAVDYLYYVANAKTQEGIYILSGGQPGNLVAWQSADNNMLCNNFFWNTQETMQKAYVRPQHVRWNQFQEQGADLLHHGIVKDISSSKVIKDLNELYQSFVQYE